MEKFSRAFGIIRRICPRFCEKICRFCESFMSSWQIPRDFTRAPNFTKTLCYGVALHLIALFALLRADIYYADDYINSANEGFWNHSRYLATFILSTLATLGKGTLDISPLPQILGVIFVVLSSMILLYLIRKKFDLLGVLASLPLGLSPHFLQNLSYKFDSLTMGIALFLAVFPFLFQARVRVFVAVSVLCLILMLMTYQAANASYIILSFYFALFVSADFKAGARFFGVCALNLIIASLIYGLFINTTNLGIGDAYATHEVIALNADFFTRFAHNLTQYFEVIFSDLKQTPFIYLIALNCTLFVANAIFCGNRRIYAVLKAILFLALGFCASYGLYLVLEKPIFEPRVFYGLNAFIALVAIVNIAESSLDSANGVRVAESTSKNPPPRIYLQKISQILRYLSLASALITAYFLISFANIYGNALKKQVEFLDFRSQILLGDLGAVPKNSSALVSVETLSDAKHPVAQRFAEKYGGISRLLPKHYLQSHLSDGWNYDSGGVCEGLRGSVVVESAYHKIEKVGACYVVTIK